VEKEARFFIRRDMGKARKKKLRKHLQYRNNSVIETDTKISQEYVSSVAGWGLDSRNNE